MKNEFIIGGWSQDLSAVPPQTFSYAMYGMITNFQGLTSGTAQWPGWSPAKTAAPQHAPCKVLWTYGGAGGSPTGTPANEQEIAQITGATTAQNWAGVDFDNESSMNIGNVARTTVELKKTGKETSYTFLAGWAFNNTPEEAGNIKSLVVNGQIDRFILMCYADAMWPMQDIVSNVGPAIEKTIAQGVDAKKVILALTYNGLTRENLDYFLDQVTGHNIGGLFIWEYPLLHSDDLAYICSKLKIN